MAKLEMELAASGFQSGALPVVLGGYVYLVLIMLFMAPLKGQQRGFILLTTVQTVAYGISSKQFML